MRKYDTPFRLRYHDVNRDQLDAHTDDEWFIARREQAMRDIHLLMMRYEISIDDLATLTRGQRYDRQD